MAVFRVEFASAPNITFQAELLRRLGKRESRLCLYD